MNLESQTLPVGAKHLFLYVPVGSIIRFNGCEAMKLDTKHVKFLKDIDGNELDYSKRSNKRYQRVTQQHIEGTPVLLIALP